LQAYRKKKQAKESKFLGSFSEEKENSPQPFVLPSTVPPTPPAQGRNAHQLSPQQLIQQLVSDPPQGTPQSFQITPDSSFQSTPQPLGRNENDPNAMLGRSLPPPPTPLRLEEAEMPEHEQAQINSLMNQVVMLQHQLHPTHLSHAHFALFF
jgi:hypothetical protein